MAVIRTKRISFFKFIGKEIIADNVDCSHHKFLSLVTEFSPDIFGNCGIVGMTQLNF